MIRRDHKSCSRVCGYELARAARQAANPSYAVWHKRVKKALGQASDYACVDCGQRAEDWSTVNLDRPGFFGGTFLADAINLPFFPAPRSSFPHILSGECTCRRSAAARCYTSQPIPGSRA